MRAIVLIMDSLGIGATPDAASFGSVGADTLGHIAKRRASAGNPLRIPHLEARGLGLAARLASGAIPAGLQVDPRILGAYGAAREISAGKDTPSGHWELAGVPVRTDWGYFPDTENCFPPDLLERIVARGDLPGFLGNRHASGTVIIEQLGEEHMRTGKPIFYTSADSVFQIAAHEESFGLQRLYDLCAIAREEVDHYAVGRVIARPFRGTRADNFKRTGNRRDLAVPPPAPTVLQKLVDAGGEVVSIGKIADIFSGCGITRKLKATGNDALWDATLTAVGETADFSIIMTNFVDFDQDYGHRRDIEGYAAALEQFDRRLPELDRLLRPDDRVIISADHGCDPTWPGTDHTREHVPVLVWGKGVKPGSLGIRDSFADVGQSLASWFDLAPFPDGVAFL
jgi:phosphopentomutase